MFTPSPNTCRWTIQCFTLFLFSGPLHMLYKDFTNVLTHYMSNVIFFFSDMQTHCIFCVLVCWCRQLSLMATTVQANMAESRAYTKYSCQQLILWHSILWAKQQLINMVRNKCFIPAVVHALP